MTIRTLYPPAQRRNITTLPPLDWMLVYYFLGEEWWELQLAVTPPFQWRIQGRGPPPCPLLFRTHWGPKKFFWETALLSKGLDDNMEKATPHPRNQGQMRHPRLERWPFISLTYRESWFITFIRGNIFFFWLYSSSLFLSALRELQLAQLTAVVWLVTSGSYNLIFQIDLRRPFSFSPISFARLWRAWRLCLRRRLNEWGWRLLFLRLLFLLRGTGNNFHLRNCLWRRILFCSLRVICVEKQKFHKSFISRYR